jgi:hypothetical protein
VRILAVNGKKTFDGFQQTRTTAAWDMVIIHPHGQKITLKKMRQKFVRKRSKNSLYDTKTRICHRGPPRRQTPCSPEVA